VPDLSLFRSTRFEVPSLETLLCHPDWFGLTKASPLQRAICRILDGLPLGDLASHPDVIASLGGEQAIELLPSTPPDEFVLLAGIRSGKSLIAAACGVKAAMACDLSGLGPGDEVAVPIVSTKKKTARQTWSHVRGRVMASRRLRPMLVGNPTGEALTFRHPSGTHVEISVTAGSRAADTLVSRWLAGAIFDEAPRMVGQEDGVVNLDDARMAVAGRMLPGAQILLIGSPWAPFGPVYDLVDKHHGKPSDELVVIRGRGPAMNPTRWTPERCASLAKRKPDAYAVDVEAQFRDPETSMFNAPELELCKRKEPLEIPRRAGRYYSAAMDPATRGNSWTLVVAENTGEKIAIVLARQWTGTTEKPLSPKAVIGEIKEILLSYGLSTVYSDQWSADANQDIAAEVSLWISTETMDNATNLELYLNLKRRVQDKTVELPPLLLLLRDISRVKKRVTQTGFTIQLPKTPDGRHCDYASSVARVLAHPPRLPDAPPLPMHGTDDRQRIDAEAAKERARLEVVKRQKEVARRVGWGR